MYIVIIIVGIILYIRISHRINELEVVIRDVSKDIATNVSVPARAQGATAVSNSETQSHSTIKSVPVPVRPQTRPAVSSEEEGGKWLGRVGIILLLLGVAFFLKYAFENGFIGVVGRIILGIVTGIGMLALGQFLREKYLRYSDLLMGGGIGILYLTIFAAHGFYNLISAPVAFFFVLMVTALSVAMSIVDDAVQLAVLGIIGGFLAPVLISTGENNLFGLFSYIFILDIGVLGVSLARKWFKLNYIAFAGTGFLWLGWFARFYTTDQLFPTLFFVTLFYLVFLVASVAHNLFRGEKSGGDDIALITFNALGYFGVSYTLLQPDYHDFLGFFAVVLALLYFVLSYVSAQRTTTDKDLSLYLSGLAVLFLTLAVPIQLSGMWITLAWFIESAVLTAFAVNVPHARFHTFGVIVFAVGLLRLFTFENDLSSAFTPYFNHVFFLFAVAIVVAYLFALFYSKITDKSAVAMEAKTVASVFFIVAHLLTVYSALTVEVSRFYDVKINDEYKRIEAQMDENNAYRGTTTYRYGAESDSTILSLQNERNTSISIAWALYAILLTAIGFMYRSRSFRLVGLILFFLTTFKIIIDVWSLGQLYRIISSIGVGVMALVGSFAYAKYKERIKEIVYE